MRFCVLLFLCCIYSARVFAQDFWVKTADLYSPPFLGSIPALATSPNGSIFAGAISKGLYRSTDDGTSWAQVNSWTPKSIAINSSGHIFSGTTGGGICRSTDNGATWTQVNNGLGPNYSTYVEAVAINSSGHIFATLTQTGQVHRTTDNGANWSGVSIGYYGTGSIVTLAINSSGYVFAGTNNGVYRSTNNGINWVQVKTGLTDTNVQVLAINSSGNIFAGTYSGGVFRSTDNGGTWVQTGLTSTSVRSLAINSTGYIFAGTNGGGVHRSTDAGTNWVQVNSGLSNMSVWSLAVNSAGYVYAGTAEAAVFRSTTSGELPSIDLSIFSGWNLVSVPLTRTNDTASVVFPTKFGSMFEYDPATARYSEALVLAMGKGYWVYYPNSTTVNIRGTLPGAITVACRTGWNLIGSRNTTVDVATLQVNSGMIFGSIFAYDAGTGRYNETLSISPGSGVWLYVTSDCTLTIP